MLRFKQPNGTVQELDPASYADVRRIVNEGMVGKLLFDESNVQDADLFLEQVRRIFGRASRTAEEVCRKLEELQVFDLEF